MKVLNLKFAVIYLILGFVSVSLFAQRSNGIAVQGKINVQQGSVEGAAIRMFQDGRQLDDYGVGADGTYKVELNYNHKYELIFTLKGNFPQKIVVESAVPNSVLQSDPKFPPFPLDINLFTEIPGIDRRFSENTVLKIYYSPNVDNFISELYYNDAQIAKLIEQAVLQAQMIGKESDYLSKLTRAELAELRKEYNQLLDQARKEYSEEKFLAALDGFKAASKILPNEQFPKDRIAEINDLLGIMMVAADLDKALSERFTALIKEGDLLFGQTKYNDAKNSYSRALSIKPNDDYANQQIKKINDLLKQLQGEEQYKELIAQADVSFDQMLYNEALTRYNSALELKKNEPYPKSKIAEINEILAKQSKDAEKQESYKEAIFQAEAMFEKQFYDKSITFYETALKIKPGDERALRKIDEVKAVMKEIADKMMFDNLVKNADKLYKKQQFTEALTDYSGAADLFPKDAYVAEKIKEINAILKADENFADLVFKADNQFNTQNFSGAKSLYNQALEIRNDDKHSLDRIREIDGILALQNLDEKYNSVLAEADKSFNDKNFDNALAKYNEAMAIKPKEKYARDKITEITGIVQQMAKTDADYQKAITRADGLFQQKDFEKAKTAFADAGKIKPSETYPVEMISKIDVLVTEQQQLAAEAEAEKVRLAQEAAAAEAVRLAAIQAEKDKNYSDAIARADEFYNQKEFEKARTEYRIAQGVKPGETYPQQKIDEIGTLMAQLSAAQKAYEDAVKIADREFKGEKFEAAKLAFNNAKQAKPDETYPREMLTKIDSIVETRARLAAEAEAEKVRLAQEAAAAEAARLAAIQVEKNKNYSDAVARADGFYNQKEFEKARTEYRTAQGVKPGETYPQQKIDEIGTLMAQLSAAQKAYEDAVKIADREFKAEKFDAAKLAFNNAKQAKPDEAYPGEMLTKIDSIVETRARLAAEAEAERTRLVQEAAAAEAARLAAIQAEKDKNYSDAIARAEEFYNQKEFEKARTEYRTAQGVKPGESYPQQKIDEIGALMAQLSAAQKAYEDAVKIADREFKAEKFDAAKLAFNNAKQAKPDETYPGEMLAKIDSIVETRTRLAAEAEAEKDRLAQEAAAAEAALLAAIQAEKDKNYSDAIARADGFYNQKEFEKARTEYRTAQGVKPVETYPQQKIDEIGTLMAQLSAAQKAYEDAVKIADREFKAEKFDAAKIAFNNAKQAKPDETYPGEMLTKIDSIVENRARLAAEAEAERTRLAQEAAAAEAARLAAIQAEKDKNYSDAIARADEYYNQKDYEKARTEYRTAQGVKPGETYPQQKIDEIGKTITALEQARKEKELTDKNYLALIQQADRFFTTKNYTQSQGKYYEALVLKAEETYPKERIVEIDKILEQQALDEKYRTIILVADGFFKTTTYLQAKDEYQKALEIKPAEAYPKNQIAKIDDLLQKEQRKVLADKNAAEDLQLRTNEIALLNEQLNATDVDSEAELDALYKQLIQQADELFDIKQYNISRGWYYKAWDVKPKETYPPQRISEINRIVGSMLSNQLDRDYQRYVDMADSTFRENQLAVSRGWYNRALSVKGNEKYPKDQLTEIERKIAEQMAGQSGQQFNLNVSKAENAFNEKNYNIAHFWYRKALELRPNDAGVKQKLVEIQEALK